MSKLQDLIKELCPNGVEFKKLGDLGKFFGGLTGKSKEDFVDGNVKFISYVNVYANPALRLDLDDKVRIFPEEKQRTLEYGDVIFTGSSETPEECGFSSVVTKKPKEKFYLNSFCFFFRLDDKSLFLPDFLKHLFRSTELRKQIVRAANGVTRFNVSKEKMAKVVVPVPPLAVQQEIVRILDIFSALTSDLTTDLSSELTLRNKQYEFYRDDLLAPCKDTPVKELKDVLTIKNGSDYKSFEEGPIPVYGSGGIISYINKAVYDKPTVLIPRKGSIDKLYYVDKPFWNVDTIFYTIINTDLVLPKYVYYFLSKFHLERLNTAGGVPSLTQAVLNKIKMPVPSLTVQKRIVDVLDNFEKICHDLKIGIPAEIDARQKQYEFYRDALLTFAETGTILTDRQTDRQKIIRLIQYVFGYAIVKLSDIATITRGGNLQKKDFVKSGLPCIHYGQMYTYFGVHTNKPLTFVNEFVFAKSKKAKTGDIVMAVTSENVADVCSCTAWLGDGEVATSGHIAIISHNQNAKYLAYFFHSEMFNAQKRRLAHGTKVLEVTPSALDDINVYLPTMEIQQQIVSILDKFDTLCSDLKSGLPSEIELRKKQYEYYRDKLLSFDELKD